MSGDKAAIAALCFPLLKKSSLRRLAGMSVDTFEADVAKWLGTAKHPRWDRLYTDLTYQPMQEVLQFMRDSGCKTYIVTGGGQDFVRVYAQRVYGIPPRWSGRSNHRQNDLISTRTFEIRLHDWKIYSIRLLRDSYRCSFAATPYRIFSLFLKSLTQP